MQPSLAPQQEWSDAGEPVVIPVGLLSTTPAVVLKMTLIAVALLYMSTGHSVIYWVCCEMEAAIKDKRYIIRMNIKTSNVVMHFLVFPWSV